MVDCFPLYHFNEERMSSRLLILVSFLLHCTTPSLPPPLLYCSLLFTVIGFRFFWSLCCAGNTRLCGVPLTFAPVRNTRETTYIGTLFLAGDVARLTHFHNRIRFSLPFPQLQNVLSSGGDADCHLFLMTERVSIGHHPKVIFFPDPPPPSSFFFTFIDIPP